MTGFNDEILFLENEVVALKAEKTKAASTLRTKKYQRSLSFDCDLNTLIGQIFSAKIAKITATSTGGEELIGMVTVEPANDDKRVYMAARVNTDDGKLCWAVGPSVFLSGDGNPQIVDGTITFTPFTLTVTVSITVSSECDISVVYEDSEFDS